MSLRDYDSPPAEMTSALAGKSADRFWTSVRATLTILAFAVPTYAFYY
jgi:putative ATP-binding cassette transporter